MKIQKKTVGATVATAAAALFIAGAAVTAAPSVTHAAYANSSTPNTIAIKLWVSIIAAMPTAEATKLVRVARLRWRIDSKRTWNSGRIQLVGSQVESLVERQVSWTQPTFRVIRIMMGRSTRQI